jgi:hypothetical protein
MMPARHESFVMLVSWNLSDFSAVDPQLDDTIVPKVRRSLHDETRASAGRARLSVASEDRAGEDQNQKNPVRSYGVHKNVSCHDQ